MSSGGLRHRLEYLAVRAATTGVSLVPESVALSLASGLGALAGSTFGIRWTEVLDRLQVAFPESDPEWRREVAVRAYRHLGREGASLVRLMKDGPAAIIERTEVEGLELLDRARRGEGGVVLVTGHFGNWELGGAAVAARGIPVQAIAFRQRNDHFDRELQESRARLGMEVVDSRGSRGRILLGLKSSKVLAFVGDQDARRAGIFVDFFNVPSSTARGPALFALRADVPLVVGVAIREHDSPATYRVILEEVTASRHGGRDEVVHRLTQAHTAILERHICAHPDQYLWLHRRWKTKPRAR